MLLIGQAYQSVNLDKHTGLCMLDGENITIDGYSPSLVYTHLGITRHAINHGCQFGSQQENVDPAVLGDVIQGVRHLLLQGTSGQVTDEVALNINSRTTLD